MQKYHISLHNIWWLYHTIDTIQRISSDNLEKKPSHWENRKLILDKNDDMILHNNDNVINTMITFWEIAPTRAES